MASSNGTGKGGSVLSREELVQGLLGDGLSEIIARPSRGKASSRKKKKDVADLTLAETKALLAEQQQTKSSLQTQTITRIYAVPQKEREYHKLLHEQVPTLAATASTKATDTAAPWEDDDVSSWRAHTSEKRPVERVPTPDDRSSSEDDSVAPRRRRDSSSDDDSDAEDRRRIARIQRVRQRQEAVVLQASSREEEEGPSSSRGEHLERNDTAAVPRGPASKADASASRTDDDDDSSSSSSSSEEDDDSSSSEDDDDDESNAMVRPKFVPKHLRDKPSMEEETAQWLEMEERHQMQEARRQQESRAMVQQVLVQAQSHKSTREYYDLDNGGSAADDDETEEEEDPVAARDAWEVRELVRILEEYAVEQARRREAQERQERQRRPWRDVDDASEAPRVEEKRRAAAGSKFFHRGAYYMDASEWDETDVRHRAAEYAQAAVVPDHQHRDRSQLPKVMRVKQFGRANQSKYKGLAAEDTTDRTMEILPIVRPKGSK